MPSGAQSKLTKTTKEQLLAENSVLRNRIDSLRNIVDSLKFAIPSADTTDSEAISSEEEQAIEERKLSQSERDSLVRVWYENRRHPDYDPDGGSIDSVRFTSNVSDTVLIERLKRMNSFITLPFNETVRNYMVLYSEKMPRKMAQVLGRSAYYMPIFEETFDRYHMPLELKYMAIIESMLNPVAESRAGARGMWQFMYSTGRSYGLKINSFVDERLDVEKAVDAAARFLSDAYNVFGDWCLAISSYNCGAGNVNKAIKRSGSREFWDIYPYLPRETRGYVPAFVGAMYAMTYYREYGIVPEAPVLPARTDTVEIHRNLHFKQINEVVGIPIDDLKELNPQYTHDIIPGNEGTQILKIPYNWTGAFLDADQDSLYLHKSSEFLNPQVIKNIKESGNEVRTAYKVRSGDYLGRIAARYHVSVSQLMKWNHLRSSNLRVGQVLYIYHRGAAPSRESDDAAKASSKPAAEPQKPSAPAQQSSTTQSGEYSTYTVKSGDTLYSIAKEYPGISAQNIMDFNHIGSSIRPGMKLRIPKTN